MILMILTRKDMWKPRLFHLKGSMPTSTGQPHVAHNTGTGHAQRSNTPSSEIWRCRDMAIGGKNLRLLLIDAPLLYFENSDILYLFCSCLGGLIGLPSLHTQFFCGSSAVLQNLPDLLNWCVMLRP